MNHVIMFAPDDGGDGGGGAPPPDGTPPGDNAPPDGGDGGSPAAPPPNAPPGDLLGDTPPGDAPPAEPPENWVDGIPEKFRENPNVTKYKSFEALLDGHENLVTMVGKKGLVAPGPDANDEVKAEFFKRIGRPDAAAEYEWEPPKAQEGDSDGHLDFDLDPDDFAQAKDGMHKLGLTQDQFKGVMDMFASDQKERMGVEQENEVVRATEAQTELRKDWGEKYDAKLDTAQAAIRRFGLNDQLRSMGLGNSAAVLKMFDSLSDMVGEHKLLGRPSESGMDFDAARQAIMDSPGWKDAHHADHAKLRQQYHDLYKNKYGK